jgi:DNA-binding GntR family transcriptional regulator
MVTLSHQSRYRLANQILDLIRDAKFELGHRLREQHLADLLLVSRTPVRSALKLLAEKGVVETQKHQGFVLATPYDQLQRLEIEVPATADQELYERLVRDRLAGDIQNSLTQSAIADRYGVDRVALLRTLSRLAEDGLVARNKGHGWTFLPMLDSRIALRASYDFRRTLEPMGIVLETFKADPVVLERCRLEHLHLIAHPDIGSVDATQLFETDAAFHEMIAEFTGNIFFRQAMQHQNRLRRLMEYGSYGNRRRVREWCQEHLSILLAIKDGDFHLAADRMKAHLSQAYAEAPLLSGPRTQGSNKRTATDGAARGSRRRDV